MVDRWPAKPYTFYALKKTFVTMRLRCDLCRRYAPLRITGLHDVDYRDRTFSCSKCGAEVYWCMVEPIKELGMDDYQLDVVEAPTHHPEPSIACSANGRARGPSTMRAANCPAARSTNGDRPGFSSSAKVGVLTA